jgi:hypothetical protein
MTNITFTPQKYEISSQFIEYLDMIFPLHIHSWKEHIKKLHEMWKYNFSVWFGYVISITYWLQLQMLSDWF